MQLPSVQFANPYYTPNVVSVIRACSNLRRVRSTFCSRGRFRSSGERELLMTIPTSGP